MERNGARGWARARPDKASDGGPRRSLITPLPGMLRRLIGAASPNDAALQRMHDDADIRAETLPPGHPSIAAFTDGTVCPMAKLTIVRQSHKATRDSAAIVHAVGGLPTLRRFTIRFYQKAFADPVLDAFIRSHEDPHGERFAAWIAEKLGVGTPWSDERRTRRIELFEAKGHSLQTPHDRSSAHFAAWHSPKRSDDVWGEHFKLDTCRVWMRLHFWACREEGLTEHAAFIDYYVRFIGHFVSVYEQAAPPFARESLRWSADAANVQRYMDAGRRMPEIMGLSHEDALAALPPDERIYSGSKDGRHWPYEQGSGM